MDSFSVAGVVFACTFSGAIFGMFLRRLLPDSHLSSESKDVVKMGTGLLATLTALVLGLLVASAKSSFDSQKAGFQQLSTSLVVLDRSLKYYGPETKEIRELIRQLVQLLLDHRWPQDGSRVSGLDGTDISERGGALFVAIRDLSPRTDAQKSLQSQAMQVCTDLARTRWSLNQGEESSIPTPFLVVMVFWLVVLFMTFGLYAPRNSTVMTVLFICAISLGGALFLIVEMDRPFSGVIQISSKPLRDALGQIGQ